MRAISHYFLLPGVSPPSSACAAARPLPHGARRPPLSAGATPPISASDSPPNAKFPPTSRFQPRRPKSTLTRGDSPSKSPGPTRKNSAAVLANVSAEPNGPPAPVPKPPRPGITVAYMCHAITHAMTQSCHVRRLRHRVADDGPHDGGRILWSSAARTSATT